MPEEKKEEAKEVKEQETAGREIHGFNIKFDESSRTLKDVAHEWKHDLSRTDLDRVLHDARHAPGGKLHMEDGKTTLIHHSDGTYTLKKRDHH